VGSRRVRFAGIQVVPDRSSGAVRRQLLEIPEEFGG